MQTPRELVLEATGRPEAFDERVLGKAMALVNPPKKDQPKMTRKRRPMNRPERRPEAVSAARARQLHVFDIPKDQCKCAAFLPKCASILTFQQRYSLYLGLHHLWTQYIATVIGTETRFEMSANLLLWVAYNFFAVRRSFGVLHPKLLKADFHGAIVTVVQSRCPSYVGHSGILLREAASMLFIIERSDRLIGSSPLTCPF